MNNRNTYFLLLALLMSSVALRAEWVNSDVARGVADLFWRERVLVGDDENSFVDISQRLGLQELYVFVGERGFVIVSKSDRVRPVLGYGVTDGHTDNDLPPQLMDILQDYSSVIRQIEIDGLEQGDGVAREWKDLTQGHYKATKGGVEPLVSTRWNQGSPYNLLCPVDTVRQRRTVAGCVAIAMAQIMKYWNYPIHGQGSHSYNASGFGRQTADFENAYYAWDKMPDSRFETDDERYAVAELVYHCGVAVNMSYGVGESGAFTCLAPDGVPKALTSFATYFDYQPTARCADRDAYGDDAWIELLKREIESGRPILCTGSDPSAGHAFVLDGYDDESLFHVNWGWGGGWDGYYAVGAFSPGSGGAGGNDTYTFNLNNSAIIGIVPNGVLKCTPDVVSVAERGGVATVFVSSNVLKSDEWEATADAEWLSLSTSTGAGLGDTTMVEITIEPNTTGAVREAVVLFAQAGDQAKLTVRQTECGVIDVFPYIEDFEDSVLCWSEIALDKLNATENGVHNVGSEAQSGTHIYRFSSANVAPNYDQYLISPYIDLPSEATLSISYRRDYSYEESFEVLTSESDVAHFDSFINSVRTVTAKRTGWNRTTARLPQTTHFVAIHYTSVHQRSLSIDDIRIEASKPQSIDDVAEVSLSPHCYVQGHTIVVDNVNGLEVEVLDMLGRSIGRGKTREGRLSVNVLRGGVYVVRIGRDVEKVVVR